MSTECEPLITVIIPVYKVEKYINRCVDSVISQSWKNLEIILVDDGSPDKCGKICDQYAEIDQRVIVIHKQNGGLSDARNAGLDIATGEYIMFVDSDDWVHPEIVERLYIGIAENDSQIAIANLLKTTSDTCESKNDFSCEFRIYDRESFLNDFYWEKHAISVVAWGKLYNKALFDGVRYPVGKIHEDAYTTPLLLMKSEKIIVTMDTMYYYFQREDSIMHSTRFEHHGEDAKATMCAMNFYKEKGYVVSYIKGMPIFLDFVQKEYRYLIEVVNDKKSAKKASGTVRKYLKLGKKIGKEFYTISIKKTPHLYEAAYPKLMKCYWIWCSFKNKILKLSKTDNYNMETNNDKN